VAVRPALAALSPNCRSLTDPLSSTSIDICSVEDVAMRLCLSAHHRAPNVMGIKDLPDPSQVNPILI
jgi:hypothetical protein